MEGPHTGYGPIEHDLRGDNTSDIVTVDEIIDTPPFVYDLDEEKEDWLGGKLLTPEMTNEEIASYSPGQRYNPETRRIESSYDVYQQDAISKSQANYNLYGNDLSKWPEAAKLQAKQSGFFGAQAEGMLGGVTGYEQEVNALKKIINEGGQGYQEALKSLAYLSGTRGAPTWTPSGEMSPGAVTPNEELAKMSALGIQKYLERKTKGNPKAIEDILTGKTQIEGLENFDFDKFAAQTGGLELATDEYGKYLKGDALGYDPSGVYTWGDVESDPWLKEAYYGLTTGDPTQIPDHLYDRYLKEILYTGGGGTFDDWWYDDPGTPWLQHWYDYPVGDETTMAKLPTWGAKPLPTETATMGEMQPIYGAEFGEELMASPLHVAGSESMTGIPYQGRPEFGTIEMPV